MTEIFQVHPAGHTPGVMPVFPQALPRGERCELPLNISVFFDGTGNNRNWDEADSCSVGLGMTQLAYRKESNVARLFAAYPDRPELGYYRLYIEGAGTPCSPIGEDKPAKFGMGFGEGCEGRIYHGLLFVLNAIHRSIAKHALFEPEAVKALCRNSRRHLRSDGTLTRLEGGVDDVLALKPWDMDEIGGLLSDGATGDRRHALRFLRKHAALIGERVAGTSKPSLISITIDVFGFSRGAMQARVFCNWLAELFEGDKLCGVSVTIRFLGIFDTVSSVGLANRTLPFDLSNGHCGWATPEALRISPKIKQCVHYMAMHENRASFPVESVRGPDGVMPPNCVQYLMPGMHSDTGGGYGPNDQGRCPSGHHSDRLSQMPLELMYQAARTVGVPLARANALLVQESNYDPFEVHPDVRQAYNNFINAVPRSGTASQYLLAYLAWRYQVREVYGTKLSWLARADAQDREDLIGANNTLLADIQVLDATDTAWSAAWHDALSRTPLVKYVMGDTGRAARKLAEDARDLLANLRAHAILGTPDNPELFTPQAFLFANYAHDSYAGFKPFDTKFGWTGCFDFIPGSWEPEGYLRYRRFYSGDNTARTGALPAPPPPAPSEWEIQRQQIQHHIDNNGIGF